MWDVLYRIGGIISLGFALGSDQLWFDPEEDTSILLYLLCFALFCYISYWLSWAGVIGFIINEKRKEEKRRVKNESEG